MMGRRLLKKLVYGLIYPAAYRLGSMRPVEKDSVLFVQVRGERGRLNENLRPVAARCKRQGMKVRAVFMDNTRGRRYLLDQLELARLSARAAVIVLDETCELYGALELRAGTRMVQLWHGCGAFKKWGLSTGEKSFGSSTEEQRRWPAHQNYTLCSVSSREVIPCYEEAFGLGPGVVKALGVPRTDWYFDEARVKAAGDRVRRRFPGKKIMVYAPTFRGETRAAKMPEGLDAGALNNVFGEEWVLLIKRHPFVKEKVRITLDKNATMGDTLFAHDVTEDFTMPQLLAAADLVITDYSSVIFEAALLGKAMVFFAPDLEGYYDARGFYYPYDESFLPGPVVRDNLQLIGAVRRCDRSRVAGFRDRFMGACDGHSTERIARYIKG